MRVNNWKKRWEKEETDGRKRKKMVKLSEDGAKIPKPPVLEGPEEDLSFKLLNTSSFVRGFLILVE